MRLVIAQRLTLGHGVGGGLEQHGQSLAQGLVARGHEVVVLTTPHPDGPGRRVEGGVEVRHVGPGTWRRYQRRWWEACYREVVGLQRADRLDLLLSQSAGALGYLPRVGGLGLPAVVVLHGTLRGELRTHWRGARTPRGFSEHRRGQRPGASR